MEMYQTSWTCGRTTGLEVKSIKKVGEEVSRYKKIIGEICELRKCFSTEESENLEHTANAFSFKN